MGAAASSEAVRDDASMEEDEGDGLPRATSCASSSAAAPAARCRGDLALTLDARRVSSPMKMIAWLRAPRAPGTLLACRIDIAARVFV